MRGFIKSSPTFFRIIKRAMALFCGIVPIIAAFIAAPLQGPADIGLVPNPVKSAWFLLWIQELVSYSTYAIYPVLLLAVLFLALPWLPPSRAVEKAQWFSREQFLVNVMTLMTFSVIVVLTIVAMFFRGKNWELIVPF
jgi:hypothetical protein